jgi:hypothetical protein
LKAVLKILWLRALLWQDRKRCQNRHSTIYTTESQFCKGKVVRAQLHRDGHKPHRMGIVDWISRQDWIDHRPISCSSVKLRKAGDCMMNKSWQEPGEAEISCVELDHLISRQHMTVASGKADVWTRPVQF